MSFLVTSVSIKLSFIIMFGLMVTCLLVEKTDQSRQKISNLKTSYSSKVLPNLGSLNPTISKSQVQVRKSEEPTTSTNNLQAIRNDKQTFKIGLIVPKTAFLSQYKTYTQRIKDTFTHLLQLSRQQQQQKKGDLNRQNLFNKALYRGPSSSSSSSAVSPSNQKTVDNKLSTSSCLAPTSQLKRFQLANLTFNHYFDIKVVDLVNLAPRTGAQDIIDSMCQKLIEQNVSVIVYLENNQDQAVTSLDTQSAMNLASPINLGIPELRQLPYKYAPNSTVSHFERENSKRVVSHLRSHNDVRQSSSQAHFIMHLAHSAGVPTIAWSVTATLAQRPKQQRTLHLAPTVAHEARAMLAIMQRYSWYSFSVISTTLAGHEDFILALRQLVSSSNSAGSNIYNSQYGSADPLGAHSNANSTTGGGGTNFRGYRQDPDISAQPIKTFKLLDAITIKQRTLANIERELHQLNISESRVILLYCTKGEAIDIFKVAKKLKLTGRSYAWIVTQSVIGSEENEQAAPEFHPGLLGIHFRSNHERLLDELSRAITIIAHGLETFVRNENLLASVDQEVNRKLSLSDSQFVNYTQTHIDSQQTVGDNSKFDTKSDTSSNHFKQIDSLTLYERLNNGRFASKASDRNFMTEYSSKLLNTYSRCYGASSKLSEKKGDLLYEYFRTSSPTNVFDANGSLEDVELNVVNLDNERQWKKIGCFSNATLTIDDITWPEQAERPPSGTMEKFHLKAVFLEEPSFVNLADPDTETGECKTNRAVRCRYKVAHPSNVSTILVNESLASDLVSGSANNSHNLTRLNRQAKGSHESENTKEDYEYKCCSGFCIDLMEKFATDLKFSYELYRVPDGLWGVLENNTWNGLISEITKGRADVIVTSVKINSDRQKAVDFTVPFLDTGISILVAKQTGVIAKLAFLEPFDTVAWIMFLGVGIPLAATSIFYFEWLSPSGFYARGNHNSDEMKTADQLALDRFSNAQHKFSFCRTLWLVITILFGSAAHIDSPKGYTARFMSNVWATFAVVFLAVYTANLAAFMITREEYIEFTGLGDSRLASPYQRHPPLKFGTITGGNTHAVLKANKPNLYSYMSRYNKLTVEDGVDAVKTGQLDAFIYDALVLDYMASQDPECRLVNVGSWFSMTGYALAFPRNSRYYEKFNMKMLEYRKNGELDRLRRFWLQGLCKPGLNRHSISKPLDLSQFMSAFLLLGAGILCSVFVLALEHLYIIYLRDRLIKSQHRRRIINWLYPFSLSLAETLRLPDDREQSTCLDQNFENTLNNMKYDCGSTTNHLETSTTFEMKELKGIQVQEKQIIVPKPKIQKGILELDRKGNNMKRNVVNRFPLINEETCETSSKLLDNLVAFMKILDDFEKRKPLIEAIEGKEIYERVKLLTHQLHNEVQPLVIASDIRYHDSPSEKSREQCIDVTHSSTKKSYTLTSCLPYIASSSSRIKYKNHHYDKLYERKRDMYPVHSSELRMKKYPTTSDIKKDLIAKPSQKWSSSVDLTDY